MPIQQSSRPGLVSIADVLGAPDVTHVFVHDVSSFARMDGFSYSVTRVARWAERALVMARPHDVVCVLEPVDPAFLAHLARLGMGPRPHHVVAAGPGAPSPSTLALADHLVQDDRALEAIRGLVAPARHVVLDPFIATAADHRLAAALERKLGRRVTVLGGHPDLLAAVNRKDVMRARAAALGVPLAPGEVVELRAEPGGRPADVAPLEDALARHVNATGRALVRGARGASGSATFVVEAARERISAVLDYVAARSDNTVYLVDSMQDVRVSPNVLMHVEPPGGRISWVGASDQRLDAALVHRGNTCPSRARTLAAMVESGRRLAAWLQDLGVQGFVGFDFCEYRDPHTGKDEHFLAEVNARINGAVYPMFVLDRINREQARHGRPTARAFLSVQALPTPARSFAGLAAHHGPLLFAPAAGRGCVPFNTGQLAHGTCSGVFLGDTPAEAMEMHEAWIASAAPPGRPSP